MSSTEHERPPNSSIGRRTVLGAAVGALGVACSGGSDQSDGGGPGALPTGTPGSFRESPMLAERVESGDLPPVAERLPKEPYVVRPGTLVDDEFVGLREGKFGGTLELPQELPTSDPSIHIGTVEPLLWAPGGFDYSAGIEANIVAGWEANGDSTVFTFHLRDGLRWSDGEPVTTEDVRFTFEDVLYNEEVTPVFPDFLLSGMAADGAPAKLAVVDELTFSLKFDRPYGSFPVQLAIGGWRRYIEVLKPRHHLEQFHRDYASAGRLKELMEAESIPENEWFNLFNAKQFSSVSDEQGIGHPTLTAWVMTKAEGGVYNYERNPYYFKVDAAGNQLPYIDGLRSQLVQDKETLTSRALFGEFDYLGERASLRQLPLIAEKAETGEIKMLVPRMHRLPISFGLNLTYADEAWRTVTREVRFRRALSLAINREEILENFYLGEFATLPAETNAPDFDVAEANRLLDEIGLADKDGDGYRLGPDGERFVVPFEVADVAEDYIPMTELIAEYWKDVGIHTTVRQISQALHSERLASNELQATVNWAHHDIWRTTGWNDLPGVRFSPLWEEWFDSGGSSGDEPPPEIKSLYENYRTYLAAPVGSAESEAAMDEFVQSYYDNVWIFAPVEHSYYPTLFTKRVKNVPEGVKQEVFGIVVMYSMEQWFIDEAE